MELEQRNCKKCGRVFSYINTLLCPACFTAEEEAFVTVRDYLREFPGSKLDMVVQETGVSAKLIKRFLREDRIEILDETQCFLECMKCKAPIKSGKYCQTCILQVNSNIKEAFVKPKAEEMLSVAKMHYASHKLKEKRAEEREKITFRDV